jgi:hypothetical protein
VPYVTAHGEETNPVIDDATHRTLAVSAFNASWTLLEKDRSDEEDRELLECAFESRHHWRIVGAATQWAIAEWMVARCFSELGYGELALRFARAAIAAEPDDAPAWMRASMLEGVARAHAAHGDRLERDAAFAAATAALAEEPDPEERKIIEDQLATVPEVGST